MPKALAHDPPDAGLHRVAGDAGRHTPEGIHQQQLRQAAVMREQERMRRAALFWQRQRTAFLRLLAESMAEFGISQAELAQARRLQAGQGAVDGEAVATPADAAPAAASTRSPTPAATPKPAAPAPSAGVRTRRRSAPGTGRERT